MNKILKKNIKYLNFGLKKKTGRNNSGVITVNSKGSGKSKRKLRIIDFYRFKYYNSKALILRIDYDPNRSANIALICYKNGFMCYIIAVEGLKNYDVINPMRNNLGVINKIINFKFGTFINCLESKVNGGFKIARAAGAYCVVLNLYLNNKIIVRLPSGEEKLFNKNVRGTVGIVSNVSWKLKKKSKAGNNIWLGKKPTVRGVAKNSVDHPNGGGRGKSSKWSICPNFTRRVLKGVSLYKKKKNINVLKTRKKWK